MSENELIKTVQQFMAASWWSQVRTLLFVMLLAFLSLPSVLSALFRR